MVTPSQIRDLRLDAEELGDEVLQVRCDGDQQLGLGLARDRFRLSASLQQIVGESRGGGAQIVEKQLIDAQQAIALVQVIESKPEGELQTGCSGNGAGGDRGCH